MEITIGQNWLSSRVSEGTFRPPGNLLLRLILLIFGTKLGVLLALLEAAAAKLEIKIGQNWLSSRVSEGTFRPPGNRLLRLILRHFRHEIRWCFAVSAVFRKRCLAAGFWLY